MAAHQSPLKPKKFRRVEKKNASKPSPGKKKKTTSTDEKKKARVKQPTPEKVKPKTPEVEKARRIESEEGLEIFEPVEGSRPAEVKERRKPTIRWKHGYTASGREPARQPGNIDNQWIYIGIGVIFAFLLCKYFF